MQKIISLVFKLVLKIKFLILGLFFTPVAKIYFYLNNVKMGKKLHVNGSLHIEVTRRGSFEFGDNFTINSGKRFNVIGRQQKTIFWIEGKLKIGKNVGMSSTAIICKQ